MIGRPLPLWNVSLRSWAKVSKGCRWNCAIVILPWKEIAGTRDHLSHGYDDVDYQVLWDAVQKDVPTLLTTIDRMLKEI